MPSVFVTSPEHIEECLRAHTPHRLHRWVCPCGGRDCHAVVVYGKDGKHHLGEGGFRFMATMTFQANPPYPSFHVDNVEDFAEFLSDERINPYDRNLYALWFAAGLREAILSAVD